MLLSPTAAPALVDADRLDRLHAECPGVIGDMQFGDLCARGDDDQHVWLSIEGLRSAGVAESDDESFVTAFDGMIAYAGSKGWLNQDATMVRAHVETTG